MSIRSNVAPIESYKIVQVSEIIYSDSLALRTTYSIRRSLIDREKFQVISKVVIL